MTAAALTRRFVVLRALRWFPLGIVLPFIILLPQARGLSLATIGAIWALHSLVTLLLELPSGALADSLGRKRVLLAGAALMGAALVGYAVAETFVVFAVAVVALGTGRALTSGALDAWYVDALHDAGAGAAMRQGLSRGTAADAGGLAVGAMVGGFLPYAFDGLARGGDGTIVYTPVTLIAAATAGVYLAMVGWLVVEEHGAPGGPPLRARVEEVARATRTTLRTSGVLWRLLVIAGSVGAGMSAIELLWQPHLAEQLDGDAGDHSVLFGLLVAGSMAAVAVGALLSPRLTRAIGPRRGYLAVVVACAVALAALAASSSPLAFVLAFVAFYALLGVADPVHSELLHNATEGAIRATVLSAESLAGQVGAVVGNLGVGAVASAGSVSLAWFIVAGLVAASALVVVRLPVAAS